MDLLSSQSTADRGSARRCIQMLEFGGRLHGERRHRLGDRHQVEARQVAAGSSGGGERRHGPASPGGGGRADQRGLRPVRRRGGVRLSG
jgi:hypothetical protein